MIAGPHVGSGRLVFGIEAAVGCKASTAARTKRPDARSVGGPRRRPALRGWR